MKRQPAKFDRCVRDVKRKGGASNAYAVCKASVKNRAKKRKKNPGDLAAKAFQEFTGRESDSVIKVTKQVHYHKHLFEIGKLRKLVIENDRYRVTLSRFGDAVLAANEGAILEALQRNGKLSQLFVEGGNQHVDLKLFGIDPKNAHENEVLGIAKLIDYDQDKVHLGSDGGKAIYRHKFRQTRIGDKHITLKVAKAPTVTYDVIDEQLKFYGGSYEIRAEGIDK